MKKQTVILISAAAVLILAAFFAPPKQNANRVPESDCTSASTVSERIEYFASHGWEVEEISGKSVTIPTEFTSAYEEYALMQDKQGLPLREYAGRNAQLYVYEVKNYSPESRKMLAELLVCDNTAIASMVYSEDGGSLRLSVS